jgi:protein involved in polysaccharide export with SLBB domain
MSLWFMMGALLATTACGPRTPNTPPPSPNVAAVGSPYLLKVGDHLDIRFYKTPELNVLDVPIRSDGKLSLELVGDIQAAGLQPDELGRQLTDKYSGELSNPRVTVIVRTFGGNIFVGGEVKNPATVPFSNGMTALQSIHASGGFLDTAKMDNVILIRLENGRWTGHRLKIDDAISGDDPSQDALLAPSDILYVPKTAIAKVDVFVDQYIRKVLPIQPAIAGF